MVCRAGVDLKQLKDELTCSICLEICIRPCSTPCGHSFCRRCLKDALRYSPKCPKCRSMFAPGGKCRNDVTDAWKGCVPLGFCLNVNTVLWNTIRMLFPKTNEAPASPPTPSPMRRATDRQLRQFLTAEAEMLRRMETERASRESYPSGAQSRMRSGEAQSSRRLRRMSSTTQENTGIASVPFEAARDFSVASPLSRAHPPAGSVGGSFSRISSGPEPYPATRNRHHPYGFVESRPHLTDNHRAAFLSSTSLNTSASSNRYTRNETRNHREDNNMQETPSSSEFPWIQSLTGESGRVPRSRSGHGFGIATSMNRSASHGDLQNDVEYVSVQRVQRVDQVPLHRRRGVYRFENYNRDRHLHQYRLNRNQELGELDAVSAAERAAAELTVTPDFDEDDFGTASDIVSDRDSSFTSSTAVPYPGGRVNSFRFREEGPSSPISTAAAAQHEDNESAAASFAGFERLYDISSQIEAAMNDIERLSLQPGWSRRTENSQPPATPLTYRSCFQLSDEEDEEDVDWNTRIRDAVFIVDDLETEFDSDGNEDEEDDDEEEEEDTVSLPVSPFNDVDGAMRQMAESHWIGSVEDSYSYY